jgi:hypothetical protein
MPQTLTAAGLTQLASAMVAGLYDGGVLLNTIYRDAEADLVVGKGDIVAIRSPQPVGAQDFTGTAVTDDLVEGKITVPINMQPYSQVKVSAKEETLQIEDFAAQVILPQVAGIVEFIDGAVAAKLETTTGTASGADWNAAIVAARDTLSANKVPTADRWLAAAPDVVGGMLQSTVFAQGNVNGAASALADGLVGRYMGFNVVESPFVTAGTAVAYHRTAVAGVFRTPVTPLGATSGSASLNGVTAQVIYTYSPSQLADVVIAQTLFGLGDGGAPDLAKRAVKVTVAVGP